MIAVEEVVSLTKEILYKRNRRKFLTNFIFFSFVTKKPVSGSVHILPNSWIRILIHNLEYGFTILVFVID